MTSNQVAPVSIWRGVLDNKTPVVISCWKITKEELETIKRTGRVWLLVMGTNMPPVHITADTPFIDT